MGSKKSKTANVVYVPTTSSASTGASAADTAAAEAKAAEEAAVKERAETVLKNKRGALGTVLTSGRGIFSLSDLTPQRKSLLGE